MLAFARVLPHELLQSQAVAERSLLSRVLAWLGISLILTAVGVYFSPYVPLPWWLLAIGALGLIFAIQGAVGARRHGLAIGLFAGFALLEGLFIGPLVLASLAVQPDAVGNALLGTVGVFMVAAAVVWLTSINLAAWGKWLFGALLIGIVLSIAAIFIGFNRLLLDLFLGAVFVGLTFFDFWRVKAQRASDNDALLMALSLYLDFINLFLILLRIFGRRR